MQVPCTFWCDILRRMGKFTTPSRSRLGRVWCLHFWWRPPAFPACKASSPSLACNARLRGPRVPSPCQGSS